MNEKFSNKELSMEEYIISIIGERPIKREDRYENLLKHYFSEIKEDEDYFKKILKLCLFIPVIVEDAQPTFSANPTLYLVLKDCFGSANALRIHGEVEFYDLQESLEVGQIITSYIAIDRDMLLTSLNNLLVKVETALSTN